MKLRARGFTRIELLAVIVVIALGVLFLITAAKAGRRQARARLIHCIGNLKNIGLAFRIFATDHGDQFPPQLSTNLGGTREFVGIGQAFRHWQVMSNELSTPALLRCADDRRVDATNFSNFGNQSISYFVGVDAAETRPNMLLAGDRFITNGLKPVGGLLELRSNLPVTWIGRPHGGAGAVALADGSCHSLSTVRLQETLRDTGDSTNRIELP